jgi:hypothetical protein
MGFKGSRTVEHPSIVNINAFFVSCNGVRRLWLALLLSLVPLVLIAQDAETGAIAGRVLDSWQGSPVAGVTVLVRGTTLGTTTDAAGNYTVSRIPPGTYAVVLSRSGYSKATLADVRVVAGQKTPADYSLKPEFFEMEAFEAVAEPILDQGTTILVERQQANIVMDVMGSEQISRLGAGDAAELVGRTTGATLVDGKFAVIRGLDERYTSTSMNKGEIPSADPYRKSGQLDLFPSELIGAVEVSKTFTPDQPGTFTGGAVNIRTKSFPEKMILNWSVGVTYNEQANLNPNFSSYPGGDLDFLGFDDGTRALPAALDGTTLPRPNLGTGAVRAANNALLFGQTRAFKTTEMGPVTSTSPLNTDLSASYGDRTKLFGRELGFFAGLSYSRKYNHYDDGVVSRYRPSGTSIEERLNLRDVRGVEEVAWGTVANLAYRLSDDHEISMNYIYTQTGESEARRLQGFNINQDEDGDVFDSTVLRYTERHMNMYQFLGKHQFPDFFHMESEWLASFATTSQEDPDLRYMSKFNRVSGLTGFANSIFPTTPTRYFRLLEEDNFTFRLDNTFPIPVWNELEAQFKTGYYYASSAREYNDRGFSYESLTGSFAPWNANGDPNSFIPIMSGSGTVDDFFIRALPKNSYFGEQIIQAGYWMSELPVTEKLRLIGGVRLETTYLAVESTGGTVATTSIQTELKQLDLLPAVGLIYSPLTNMNVRLHYSQTIGRPSYREIANVESFDFAGGDTLVGNPNLKMAAVNNYDLRWEWYPRPGYIVAVGAFYKEIANPIEQAFVTLDGEKIIYDNREFATVQGLEFEARASFDFIDDLLADFNGGFNFAYIESTTDLTPTELQNKRLIDPAEPETRPLYNQSPYIINFDLGYDNRKSGTAATIAYNIAGERLVITNPFGKDIYQQPAASLDFSISQKLGRSQRWKIKLSAKNLLDPINARTYGAEPDGRIYSRSSRGRSYGVSLSYSY